MEQLLTTPSANLETFSAHGVRWTATAVGAAVLRSPDLSSLHPSEILRELPGRQVSLHRTAAGLAVLKTARPRGILRRLLQILRPAPGRVEWTRLWEAHSRGLPVPEPLAYGTDAGGASLLLTRFTEGTDLRALFEGGYVPSPEDGQVLARFLRLMHDAGILHRDFHPGNLLCTGDKDEPLLLLDGQALDFRDSLGLDDRLASLAHLNLFFFLRVSRSARRRFFRQVARGLSLSREGERAAARRVEALTAALAHRAWTSGARRCTRASREFRPFAQAEARGFLRRGPLGEALEKALGGLFQPDGEVIKNSRGALTSLRSFPEGSVVVKASRPRTAGEAFRGCFRTPRAVRAWRTAWAFEQRGLPAVRGVLAAVPRSGAKGSVLCTEAVPDAAGLDRWLADAEPDRGASLIETLGQILADMHDRGITHRDLKASNLLVSRGRVVLCDLDGAKVLAHPVPAQRRAKDLRRLLRSLKEDCRGSEVLAPALLKAYARRSTDRRAGEMTGVLLETVM